MTGNGQVRVEVVIERHADPVRYSREFQNLWIVRVSHSDLTDVNRFVALLPEQRRGTGRQTLVQKKRDHATLSIFRLSSSTVAAA